MHTNMTGFASDRPQHNHLTQARRSPVAGCPACDLIRPEVMTMHPFAIEAASAARQLPPLRTPERTAR